MVALHRLHLTDIDTLSPLEQLDPFKTHNNSIHPTINSRATVCSNPFPPWISTSLSSKVKLSLTFTQNRLTNIDTYYTLWATVYTTVLSLLSICLLDCAEFAQWKIHLSHKRTHEIPSYMRLPPRNPPTRNHTRKEQHSKGSTFTKKCYHHYYG